MAGAGLNRTPEVLNAVDGLMDTQLEVREVNTNLDIFF